MFNFKMAAPVVLISSCSDFDASSIVTGILGVETLPSPTACRIPNLTCYPWPVDTKYYTAQTELCVSTTKTMGDREFASRVEAILLYFDGGPSSFDLVKAWLPFVKQIEPEVKLLITERCTEAAGRNEYMELCVEYAFELVETDPSDTSEQDDEENEDFAEPRGYERVVSALQAHTWSNLVLKDSSTNFPSPFMRTLMQQGGGAATAVETCDEKGAKEENESETKNKSDKEDGMSQLLQALGTEESGDESFEALFERMKVMKEEAERLPESERKEYAEKMAVQFMKAMGCDDELGGLCSDDGEP